MKKCTFEKIVEEDIESVREIYLYYIQNSTATFHKRDISYQEMKELVIFNNPKYESYTIYYEGELCGYVILTQYKVREAFDQSAEITIYLKQGFEGKGIGTQAVNFIEDRARTKDLHVLLALVCGENTGSMALFEKMGYVKCAHYKEVGYKFGRWLDLVGYEKIIS
ncbi:GNAT family N-acetyltransferase [Sporanaerobium hydrogeniformans]|uniref:GNAT family N-acetyltransferase n=1 Tax=Sporanaerobium hydrogeniformans TaxID=3072179 RepID=A0AC61D681_9FIRM|nr:GNAT family N-acetyltransferase [Sporanaerobium hydrogeniformans]PHV69219.1 GNAT family N-acetyltransferase [Sporanaerobium hydrogeniformans]